jgi:integrase
MDTSVTVFNPVENNTGKLIKSNQQLAIRSAEAGASDYIPHLTPDQVKQIAAGATNERDRLLILIMFDCCLRCSEAIDIRPNDFEKTPTGWLLRVAHGKGNKYNKVAISNSLVSQIQAYCYQSRLDPDNKVFPFSRPRAFQIIAEAYKVSGIPRPSKDRDRVGTVHILRHSGAIERLRLTGNPKAVQDQLRHKSAVMTLRYMKTITHDESLKVQQGVDFQW